MYTYDDVTVFSRIRGRWLADVTSVTHTDRQTELTLSIDALNSKGAPNNQSLRYDYWDLGYQRPTLVTSSTKTLTTAHPAQHDLRRPPVACCDVASHDLGRRSSQDVVGHRILRLRGISSFFISNKYRINYSRQTMKNYDPRKIT